MDSIGDRLGAANPAGAFSSGRQLSGAFSGYGSGCGTKGADAAAAAAADAGTMTLLELVALGMAMFAMLQTIMMTRRRRSGGDLDLDLRSRTNTLEEDPTYYATMESIRKSYIDTTTTTTKRSIYDYFTASIPTERTTVKRTSVRPIPGTTVRIDRGSDKEHLPAAEDFFSMALKLDDPSFQIDPVIDYQGLDLPGAPLPEFTGAIDRDTKLPGASLADFTGAVDRDTKLSGAPMPDFTATGNMDSEQAVEFTGAMNRDPVRGNPVEKLIDDFLAQQGVQGATPSVYDNLQHLDSPLASLRDGYKRDLSEVFSKGTQTIFLTVASLYSANLV